TDTSRDNVFPLGYSTVATRDEKEFSVMEVIGRIRYNTKIVSFVGSWGESYDIQLLLETARRLIHRRDILFVIAGDSSSQPRLERSLKELPNVMLTGWLNRYQVASLLRHTAIGILPYKPNAPQGLPNK